MAYTTKRGRDRFSHQGYFYWRDKVSTIDPDTAFWVRVRFHRLLAVEKKQAQL
ncbi:MAG: hypothetical protein GY820_26800 [Gammaproteobacteria bacterium]|nr:hypothetical protein [Gammaproteobacteria bacterium]